MMTNSQCQAYAFLALRNLIKDSSIKADKDIFRKFDSELYRLFDNISEEEAEDKMNRLW